MSGHSHWQNIKHKKETEDARKSRLFSKFSRLISVAARKGGGDPEENFKLRDAIERAREADMPQETIDRALKRGTGEMEGVDFEEAVFEAYGPGGVAVIIETITDNRNRTVGELKNLLEEKGGSLAEPGSVKYRFERKGNISLELEAQPERFKDRERMEMAAIEAGAEELSWSGGFLDVYVDLEDLEEVESELVGKGLLVESAIPGWKTENEITLPGKEKKEAESLFQALSAHDDVQEIYTNLE